jgi:transposase InsO family protein
MSDNGSGYIGAAHAIACRALDVRHTRIRPGRPRTNGKAERFIQTLLNVWAYVRLYGTPKNASTSSGATSSDTTSDDHMAP